LRWLYPHCGGKAKTEEPGKGPEGGGICGRRRQPYDMVTVRGVRKVN